MKKWLMCLSVVTVVGTFCRADSATPTAPVPPPSATTAKPAGPCKDILAACSDAGFVKGEAKEGNGLYKDCFQPIVHGQTVAKVTVDPAVVTACQQKIQNHRNKKAATGSTTQEPAAAPEAATAQ